MRERVAAARGIERAALGMGVAVPLLYFGTTIRRPEDPPRTAGF